MTVQADEKKDSAWVGGKDTLAEAGDDEAFADDRFMWSTAGGAGRRQRP